jgi:LPXTG-motif cell wall-anchored protein
MPGSLACPGVGQELSRMDHGYGPVKALTSGSEHTAWYSATKTFGSITVKVRLAIASLIAAGTAVALPVGIAHADPCPTSAAGGSCTAPSAQVIGTGGFVQPAVQAVQAGPSGASLPLTGGDVAGLSFIGVLLLGGGTVLVRRTRVRSAENTD